MMDFQAVEELLGKPSAQSPVSLLVASPGHAMGHCRVKYSICSLQQVWWSLHWVLRPGLAGGFKWMVLF